MHSAISAAIAYIEVSQAAGTSEEILTSITKNRLDNLRSMLGKSTPSLDDTTAAISLVGSTKAFNHEQKQALLGAIHTKVQSSSLDGDEGADTTKAQSHKYVENYLTEALYNILDNKDIPEVERIEAFVDFLQLRNGCKFPDVSSRKRFVAIISLCNGTNATAKALKASYDKFAEINIRKRKLRVLAPTTMKVFPENPKEFASLHPCSYLEGQPYVVSRLSSSMIDEVVGMTSARKTNSLINSKSEAPATLPVHSGVVSSTDVMHMDGVKQGFQMMGQMMQMMMGSSGRRGAEEPHVNFRFGPYGGSPSRLHLSDGPSSAGAGRPGASSGGLSCPPPGDGSQANSKESGGTDVGVDEACEEDEIDAMITQKRVNFKGLKPRGKKGAKVMKSRAKKGAKFIAKDDTVKKVTKQDATFPLNKPPKFGTALPLTFNGCRVCSGGNRYRVVPFPSKSVYDRAFKFKKGDEARAWKDVLAFCKKPTIPSTSSNAIK